MATSFAFFAVVFVTVSSFSMSTATAGTSNSTAEPVWHCQLWSLGSVHKNYVHCDAILSRSSPAGTVLGKLPRDLDDFAYTKVDSGSGACGWQHFDLDNGTITTNKVLDREQCTEFLLPADVYGRITVNTTGHFPGSVRVKLAADASEYPPLIEFCRPTPIPIRLFKAPLEVAVNAPLWTWYVFGNDTRGTEFSQGISGRDARFFNASLTSSKFFNGARGYALRAAVPLAFAEQDTYNIRLTARDSGNLTDECDLQFVLLDARSRFVDCRSIKTGTVQYGQVVGSVNVESYYSYRKPTINGTGAMFFSLLEDSPAAECYEGWHCQHISIVSKNAISSDLLEEFDIRLEFDGERGSNVCRIEFDNEAALGHSWAVSIVLLAVVAVISFVVGCFLRGRSSRRSLTPTWDDATKPLSGGVLLPEDALSSDNENE